jgi:hypothetical protein
VGNQQNERLNLNMEFVMSNTDEEHIRILLARAAAALSNSDALRCLHLCVTAKKLQKPYEGLDTLRALAFAALHRPHDALEALKEELRLFPGNADAASLSANLEQSLVKEIPETCDAEFLRLYSIVRHCTMVGSARLYSLYRHAVAVCRRNEHPGNFVECGVAGGGSSALLAAVVKRYGNAETRLFCCDSFSGMPPASQCDTHAGQNADTTGWGHGTCAAPESCLQTICGQVGAADRIEIVKGYFCDTLSAWKERMTPIVFLHMDGDWYESTRDILVNLYDCLLPGACIQVDDYGYWDGCRKAVHEFFDQRGIAPALRKIDASGVWFVKPVCA